MNELKKKLFGERLPLRADTGREDGKEGSRLGDQVSKKAGLCWAVQGDHEVISWLQMHLLTPSSPSLGRFLSWGYFIHKVPPGPEKQLPKVLTAEALTWRVWNIQGPVPARLG